MVRTEANPDIMGVGEGVALTDFFVAFYTYFLQRGPLDHSKGTKKSKKGGGSQSFF